MSAKTYLTLGLVSGALGVAGGVALLLNGDTFAGLGGIASGAVCFFIIWRERSLWR